MASRRASSSLMTVVLIVVVLVAGVVTTTMLLGGSTASDETEAPDVYLVRRGSFDVTVPTSGELAALSQVEIRNQLESQATITEIVAEGTFVKAGEVLMRLNDEDLRDRIQSEQESVNDAANRHENAVANEAITRKDRESQLARADLQIRLSELALQAWEEGQEIARRRELELAIETSEKEYIRAQERYDKSVELEKENFISTDELKGDEISMINAKAALERAALDLQVYERYTYEQDKAQKESDLQQAKDERERTQQKMDAEVRSAVSDVENTKMQLESKQDRLERLKEQLGHTTILAPTDGLVVYASSLRSGRDWRDSGQPPQVGTQLSRNQMVMVLPDTSQMVAEIKVNEALSGQITADQRVVVTSDARPDEPMSGKVLSVGVLAESGGWRDPNRRDYTVRALLDEGGLEGLKPSMRCNAVIYVDRVEDALFVPIQAIFRKGRTSFVYIPESGGYAQRAVKFGQASELYVQILDGLEGGELVLLREPRVDEIVSTLDIPDEEGPTQPMAPPGAGTSRSEGPPAGAGGESRGSAGSGGLEDWDGKLPDGRQLTPEQIEQFRQMRERGQNGGAGGDGRGDRRGGERGPGARRGGPDGERGGGREREPGGATGPETSPPSD